MKYAEAEKKLKAAGCYWVDDGSRHPLWYSPLTGKQFAMSYHRSEEIATGTKHQISKLSGVKL